jgi:hypothetical protein
MVQVLEWHFSGGRTLRLDIGSARPVVTGTGKTGVEVPGEWSEARELQPFIMRVAPGGARGRR